MLPEHQLIGNRYQIIRQIGAGGMGKVYRATDRLSGDVVALKMVTVAGEKLQFASKSDSGDFHFALAQEFHTLATLRHPYIISVLDYGFNLDPTSGERQPFFAMELLENASPLTRVTRAMSRTQRLILLTQMAQALTYLHRRGIVHRDLKPDNVMVIKSPEGEYQVRVLDFGLAVGHGQGIEAQAGTLAYMAPELIQGYAPSPQSDLFAAGLIIYEVLTGRHPFDTSNITTLINDLVWSEAQLSDLEMEPELCELITRLLEKDPANRMRSARELTSGLIALSGEDIPIENENIRESYLQAAKFVGREQEMTLLTNALDRILIPAETEATGPLGSVWLVGGESGVGKSRLLDELRIQALVNGALVLRGQAQPELAIPYMMWQDILRQLSLQIELTPLEISVLKAYVHDLDRLLNYEGSLDKMQQSEIITNQTLLMQTVESLFRRQSRPVVVILENLHLAREDSFNMLKYLSRLAGSMRLMILASFRSDEAPSLADRMPDVELIELHRLPRETIAALSESMLGEAGRNEMIVEILERETEGNVFFIVEAVRALAEESGDLAEIGRKTLPEKIFAEGIKSIVQRRLDGVPEEARPLLYTAAVMGRELDMDILPMMESPMDFGDWLYVCEMAIILEINNGHWQFVHDKLREGLIDELTPEVYKDVHRNAAEMIEQTHPGNPEYAVRLASLWGGAGEQKKELPYTLIAARQMILKEDYARALDFYERAMELGPLSEDGAAHLAKVYAGIGEIYTATGRFNDAALFLEEGYGVAKENTLLKEQGLLLRALGVLEGTRSADYEKVLDYWQKNLTIQEKLRDQAAIAATLNDVALARMMLNQHDAALADLERSTDIAKALGEDVQVARNLMDMGNIELHRQNYVLAQQHFEQSLTRFAALSQNALVVTAFFNLARVALGMKQPDTARMYNVQATELARALENTRQLIAAIDTQATIDIQNGHPEKVVEYLSFTDLYRHYSDLFEEERHSMMQSIGKLLPVEHFEKAVLRGKTRKLDDIIDEILAKEA